MSAVAHLHLFILVKIFAPGVASLIRDFAAVAGGAEFGFHLCCPIAGGVVHTVHSHASTLPNVQRSGQWRIRPRGLDESFEVVVKMLT